MEELILITVVIALTMIAPDAALIAFLGMMFSLIAISYFFIANEILVLVGVIIFLAIYLSWICITSHFNLRERYIFSANNTSSHNSHHFTDSHNYLIKYRQRLEKYYKKHSPRIELSNNNVHLRLISNDLDNTCFYCINKKSKVGTLERFIYKTKSRRIAEELLTLWAILDMEFNSNTTYRDILNSYPIKNRLIHSPTTNEQRLNNVHMIIKEFPYIIFYEKTNHKQNMKKKVGNTKHVTKNRKAQTYPKNYFIVKADIETIYYIYYTIITKYKNKKFSELYYLLSQRKDCNVEKFVYEPKQKQKQGNLININEVSEEKLSALPGINIILAKRIIQHRDYIEGFKSKEEFYAFCKLKEHFIKQIDNKITAGKYNIIEIIFHENERIVDAFDCDSDEIDNYDGDDDIVVDL